MMEPIDVKKVEEWLIKNPEFVVSMAILSFAVIAKKEGKRPAHLKDMPPVNPRTAGPWRGKGSFGRNFGPTKVSHK